MGRGLNNGIAKILAILSLVAMMGSPVHAYDNGLSLPKSGADPVAVRLSATAPDGLDASELLQVFFGSPDTCCEHRIPMAGSYILSNEALTFSPAFGFDPGQDYVARVWTMQNEHMLHAFRIADEVASVRATVTETYPSGETLPENVLRFYIHFSVPMAPHVAFDYIKLRDASGADDEAAFMRFKQELWNEDRTRLTVLIDPGRIKREVATNVELGPALRAGERYALVVEEGWPSADGASELAAFTKTFQVSDALRTRPDASSWSTNAPCVHTREPLIVAFDRPYDRHLLTHKIRVEAGVHNRIGGLIEVDTAEQIWRFTPALPWSADDVRLIADTTLEDVAGNNFEDLLDHASSDVGEIPVTSLSIVLDPNCN